jgi:hypothetical protein
MSPYSTPNLPVKNPDSCYRLVQDLRAIIQIVQSRHPGVPNPYTLLSKIPHDHKWLPVVNLKDAFGAYPLAEENRDLSLNGKKTQKGRKK